MLLDIHHEGTAESHPFRIRELTPEGWRLVRNVAGQPRKFQSMIGAYSWAADRQDRGVALDGYNELVEG